MPQDPERFGYTTERAFGSLAVTDPVAIVTPPGETNRLFVVEQAGRIVVITNLAEPTRSVFLDIRSQVVSGGERGLLGLAFHPGFATNRQFFIFYTLNTQTAAGGGLHDRLSRFLVSETNPHLADPASEMPLLSQYDQAGNHNGGDLKFGPDGYLYVALGDEGGGDDSYNNSQRIDKDYFAGLLRIDVDQRPGNLPPNPHPANTNELGMSFYSVPADNPFVGATNFLGRPVDPARVRTEFWAVGLRNPWRIAFDQETGQLLAADVGQNRWEEINLIVRGGNYGWSYREGNAPGPRSNPPAGADFLAPLVVYGHGSRTNQGNSVTGGVVYRGERLPALSGSYIFADYVSGHIWSTRHTGATNSPMQWLATDTGIAGFGIDPRNGDVLMADQNQDTVKRLVLGEPIGDPLPPTLADTGAFADLITLQPHSGIVPYEVNAPFWSDGASKKRWFSVPNTNLVIRFDPTNHWQSPTGTVWIKHFELETIQGVPASARRLETRFLVRNAGGIYGVTYRWDETQTNAYLVPQEGLDEPLLVYDNGLLRTQLWHYPSRSECLTCHTPQGGLSLSFNTPQLNRNVLAADGQVTNQIQRLASAGYLDQPAVEVDHLPQLASATNTHFSITHRVKSYLEANCAMCHQPSAGAVGFWDARFSTPLHRAGLINSPLSDTGNDPSNRVVVPGSTNLSQLLVRISFRGPGQMPPIASHRVDLQGVALLSAWITNSLIGYVPPTLSFQEWQATNFASASLPEARPWIDADADGQANYVEYLLGYNPNSRKDRWTASLQPIDGALRLLFPRVENHGQELRLELAPNLEGPWYEINPGAPSPFFGEGQGSIEWPTPPGSQNLFYRLRLLTP